MEFAAYRSKRDNKFYASHVQTILGTHIKYSTILNKINHAFQYSLHHRKISHLSPDASFSIAEAAGDSILSSIGYILTRDTRNDFLLPKKGSFIQITQELTGKFFGGDTSFYRITGEGQISYDLGNRLALTFSSKCGLLTDIFSHS